MLRILIVDDSYIIRKSLRKTLEQLNSEVLVSGEAANGCEALKWLEGNYADLCITDIKMPLMDGLELISNLNKLYPWMSTLIISSYDDFEFARKSIQLRTCDYILKPIDNDFVYQAIQNVIGTQRINREKEAAQILLSKFSNHKKIIGQWIETLKTTRQELIPKLTLETVKVLKEWTSTHFYLLPQLAKNWVKAIFEELQDSKSFTPEDIECGISDHKTINLSDTENHFVMTATRILENGANLLIKETLKKKDSQATKMIENIKEYVRNHFREDIKLQELAEYVALNKTYMCTIFKQETKMTVWNFIVSERMNMAREKLIHSTDKIYEIANFVGYEDVNYFSTLFRKHFGLSPLDYRKSALR